MTIQKKIEILKYMLNEASYVKDESHFIGYTEAIKDLIDLLNEEES